MHSHGFSAPNGDDSSSADASTRNKPAVPHHVLHEHVHYGIRSVYEQRVRAPAAERADRAAARHRHPSDIPCPEPRIREYERVQSLQTNGPAERERAAGRSAPHELFVFVRGAVVYGVETRPRIDSFRLPGDEAATRSRALRGEAENGGRSGTKRDEWKWWKWWNDDVAVAEHPADGVGAEHVANDVGINERSGGAGGLVDANRRADRIAGLSESELGVRGYYLEVYESKLANEISTVWHIL